MSTSEFTSPKLNLETDGLVDSEDLTMDDFLTQQGSVFKWEASDFDEQHQNTYPTHIRRLSSPNDPFMQQTETLYQKPMLHFPNYYHHQQQYVPGWQAYQYNTSEYRHLSPMSRVSSSSGLDRSLSMSPEMATAMLASMVDDHGMYSSSPGMSMGYHTLPSTMPTGITTYSPPTPVLPSQHFSMRDFQNFPDTEEPPLLEVNEVLESRAAEQKSTAPLPLRDSDNLGIFSTMLPHSDIDADQLGHIRNEYGRHSRTIAAKVVHKDSHGASKANAIKLSSPHTFVTHLPDVTTPHQVSSTTSKKHARSPSSPAKTSPSTTINKKRRLSISTVTSAKIHSNKAKAKPILPCPFHHFGCLATFPNKNEWKRHTLSQHLRLGFYRCSLGTCNIGHPSGVTKTRGYNDFNRKDLFVQHLRRMHAPMVAEADAQKVRGHLKKVKSNASPIAGKKGRKDEDEDAWIEDVRRSAWVGVRVAPGGDEAVGCGFCEQQFGGEEDSDDEVQPSRGGRQTNIMTTRTLADEGKGQAIEIWERRMEHVAAHYARGCKVDDEELDEQLKQWAIKEGLVVDAAAGGGLILASLVEAASADAAGLETWSERAITASVDPARDMTTGVRRKGKTSRLGSVAARFAARDGSSGASSPFNPSLDGGSSRRPGSRKSERLLGGHKRRYAEFEEDELSVYERDDSDDGGRRKKVKHIHLARAGSHLSNGSESILHQNEERDEDDAVDAGSDTDTDAPGEDEY